MLLLITCTSDLLKYSLKLAILLLLLLLLLSNCNIIYEGERLLIHLMRPTTKEEKHTQDNVNTHKTVLLSTVSCVFTSRIGIKIKDQCKCVHE